MPYEVKKNGQFYLIRVQLQNHRCTHLLLLSRCVDIKNVHVFLYIESYSVNLFLSLYLMAEKGLFYHL